MNPIIESDIAHIAQVMRASTLSCAPHITLVDYWRRRLLSLMKMDDLTEFQLSSLQGLLRELGEIETQLSGMRADKLRGAVMAHHAPGPAMYPPLLRRVSG
jgi:hypothetical protein